MSNRRLPMALDTSAVARERVVAELGDGFYPPEREAVDVYRWMGRSGRITVAPAAAERFLDLSVQSSYHDLSQLLTVVAGDVRLELALVHGWSSLSIELPAGVGEVALAADPPLPGVLHQGDPRELTVRVRSAFAHGDPARHASIVQQQANGVAVTREMLAGSVRLESTPRKLGVDIYGECNVKPPCVYCGEFSKELENRNVSRPFDVSTLRTYGPLYDGASELINCSIGEPFMLKEFDDVLDDLGDRGKSLEMSSNGQILTDRNIERLLGRDISLYVSLDAATPETYRKLRNDTFERILGNLRRLLEARGDGQLPRLFLVFMPMRINLDELEGFVRLCADLGADRLVLRPLNESPAVELEWERDGYRFDYQRELLPFDELVRASGRAAGWCERYGVELSDQMDFGDRLDGMFATRFAEGRREAAGAAPEATPASAPAPVPEPVPEPAPAPAPGPEPSGPLPTLGADRVPICTEPWTSLYLLRRGVLPCCHGAAPIADLDDAEKAWNGAEMQAIRGELAAGRLHDYCTRSTTCPIVRKAVAAESVPAKQARRMRLRRAFTRVDQALGGAPRSLYQSLKRLAGRP